MQASATSGVERSANASMLGRYPAEGACEASCHHSVMRVIASDPAVELIEQRGGQLFVWPTRSRCCGAVARLESSTEQPPNRAFRRVDAESGFELFLPEHLARAPDELHVAVRRFPRRVEAYWNGCAWIA